MILRTSNEPAEGLPLSLLWILPWRLALGRQALYPINIHSSAFPKPQAIHLVSQIRHEDVFFCRWFAITALPPRYGRLCDLQAFYVSGLSAIRARAGDHIEIVQLQNRTQVPREKYSPPSHPPNLLRPQDLETAARPGFIDDIVRELTEGE